MNKHNTLWVEAYRPSSLEEYIGSEGIKSFISKCINTNDIPHLLFVGKAGTGKTTLAKLITKHINCESIYINASDERGIDTVRDKIVEFASSNSFAPLKIIVLDEYDYVTPQAQAALRNIMETYSSKTRFILTANYLERIIEPIKSRCQMFNIEPPSKPAIAEYVVDILTKNDITYDIKDVVDVIKSYYPDIRKIINILQQFTTEDKKLILDGYRGNNDNLINVLVNLLKNKNTKTWSLIRQEVANAEISDYTYLYTELFNRAQEYTSSPAEVAIHSAQYLWQNNSIADKELNFCAYISQLLKIK